MGKCDHCKKHHELYLNYNSENNSSSWAHMMDFFLNGINYKIWTMRTKKKPTISNLNKKQIHFAAMVHYFWNVAGEKMGINEKSNLFKKWEKSKSNSSG